MAIDLSGLFDALPEAADAGLSTYFGLKDRERSEKEAEERARDRALQRELTQEQIANAREDRERMRRDREQARRLSEATAGLLRQRYPEMGEDEALAIASSGQVAYTDLLEGDDRLTREQLEAFGDVFDDDELEILANAPDRDTQNALFGVKQTSTNLQVAMANLEAANRRDGLTPGQQIEVDRQEVADAVTSGLIVPLTGTADEFGELGDVGPEETARLRRNYSRLVERFGKEPVDAAFYTQATSRDAPFGLASAHRLFAPPPQRRRRPPPRPTGVPGTTPADTPSFQDLLSPPGPPATPGPITSDRSEAAPRPGLPQGPQNRNPITPGLPASVGLGGGLSAAGPNIAGVSSDVPVDLGAFMRKLLEPKEGTGRVGDLFRSGQLR